MTHDPAYRPGRLRVRPLSIEARQRRAALKRRDPAPGQVYTDWASI